MNAKRDHLAIMNEMLDFIRSKSDKAKPTQIMYKANLSHEMLSGYVKELLAKELISEAKDKQGKRTYSLTGKGYSFLKDYRQMKGFLESYDLS